MNKPKYFLVKVWPHFSEPSHRHWLYAGLLLGATAFCIFLWATRLLIVGRHWLLYLVWNLFLAWLPVWLAAASWLVERTRRRITWEVLALAAGWLLFFPNAAYLVTDLIHLKADAPIPLWFDAVLFSGFAATGLLLGHGSLFLMQSQVARRFNARLGWAFVAGVCALGAFGVYLGRFERWNSRDLMLKPLELLNGIGAACVSLVSEPEAMEFTLLFGAFMLGGYVLCHRWLRGPQVVR